MITSLDHVVVGVRDLDEGIGWWEAQTGVRPERGGPHEGLGTHNAIASLGGELYLELISVDPDQNATSPARDWLGQLDQPRPFGWCFRCDDAARTHDALKAAQINAARIPMSRVRPDAAEVSWELVYPLHTLGPVIPFLIAWGSTPSPASGAPEGCSLADVTPMHPEPERAQAIFDRMEIDTKVIRGPRSGPALRFESQQGTLLVEP